MFFLWNGNEIVIGDLNESIDIDVLRIFGF